MTDLAWIHGALTAARPQAVGALLRYFRDMDRAEEAFQDACLRALKSWPDKGPPRDPTAWLILVGRNAALDGVRKQSRTTELPPDDQISDLGDAESELAERLDGSHYRDDVLRLLFICCHPELPATSRSPWRCASCPVLPCRRSPAPFWSVKRRWSSASPALRAASPRRRCRSRHRARPNAPSGW